MDKLGSIPLPTRTPVGTDMTDMAASDQMGDTTKLPSIPECKKTFHPSTIEGSNLSDSIRERIKEEMKVSTRMSSSALTADKTRSDIVDEMFRDFLAQKMEMVEKEYNVRKRQQEDQQEKDPISFIPDKKVKTTHNVTKSKKRDHKSKKLAICTDNRKSVNPPTATSTDDGTVYVRAMTTALRSLAESSPGHQAEPEQSETKLPVIKESGVLASTCLSETTQSVDGKRMVIPLKISSLSASIISSGEVITQVSKMRKQLEEGEVLSSKSEGTSDDEASDDSDGEDAEVNKDEKELSETGSITDSDSKKSKSKKKKKKHKHKHAKHKQKKKKKKTKKKKSYKSRSRSKSPKSRRRSASWSPSRDHYHDLSPRRDDSKWAEDRGRPVELFSRSYRKRHGMSERRRSRSRSRSCERTRAKDREKSERKRRREEELHIDKAKLRRIAIANAVHMMKSGGSSSVSADTMAKLKAGGKSVEELTDYCKKISEKEKLREQQRVERVDDSLSDSSEGDAESVKSEDEDFTIHHPFTVKEVPNIVMNIRNAQQLPTLTPQEKVTESAKLRLTFPVSSGSQHRAKESEWVPVEKTTSTTSITTTTTVSQIPTAVPSQTLDTTATSLTTAAEVAMEVATVKAPEQAKVSPDPPEKAIDIGTIISERLAAVRRLQRNPNDVQAITQMHSAQKKASQWAESKVLPGQFTGSTGATILSQQELMGPDKKRQAWAKKEQLTTAAPVTGGFGMMMLQKLGWKQGEGLGKNRDGPQTPLMLDVKVDRKGLTSQEESQKKTLAPKKAPVRDLSGKHPVSGLVELCSKRRWGTPEFILVQESGPAHKKNFVFKVCVNGVEYQSSVASNNKKQAKAQAATVCLQELGLLPR